jgi:hypothetical protein
MVSIIKPFSKDHWYQIVLILIAAILLSRILIYKDRTLSKRPPRNGEKRKYRIRW